MVTISITFSKLLKFISCETTPSKRFASGKFSSVSISNIFTLPAVLVTNDAIIPIVDDFPAPFGPSNAKKSPSFTERFIPFKATTSESYIFLRSIISRAN